MYTHCCTNIQVLIGLPTRFMLLWFFKLKSSQGYITKLKSIVTMNSAHAYYLIYTACTEEVKAQGKGKVCPV